jgi:NAD+ synthase
MKRIGKAPALRYSVAMQSPAKLIIALAQLNQNVGDCAANAAAICRARATVMDTDVLLAPELHLIGYPPEDLVLKPSFVEAAEKALATLACVTADGGPAILIGTVTHAHGKLYNSVALLDAGRVQAVRHKHQLPNYGTFDEMRVFAAGDLPEPIEVRGVRIGVPICEDIWHTAVCAHLREQGAELLLCPNGSPYDSLKHGERLEKVRARVAETHLPLAYLNRIGGQDELVFDGASFVLNTDGTAALQLPAWQESVRRTHWHKQAQGWVCQTGEISLLPPQLEADYSAMVLALRDYVGRNGFPGVVLGLSGGIDSALSAAVAVDALGAEKVWCVMLPSQFTSRESLEDAAACAQALGVRLDTLPIHPAVAGFETMLHAQLAGAPPGTVQENIQSRTRGLALMALSNAYGHMLLTTGNKSEMAVGYATIYGDMAGGYNVLKDVYKMHVFALARWRNTARPAIGLGPEGVVIPERILTKPPSAELRDNQRDDDSLPPYEILDAILHALVEEEASVAQVVARGFVRETVQRIARLLTLAEYKRRQAPPGVKISARNFGRDRRYPITHGYSGAPPE